MAIFFMTYGYPVSIAVSSDTIDGYVVEIAPGKDVLLTSEYSVVWANLLNSGFSDDLSTVENLAGLGLLIAGNSKKDLIEQCSNLYPIRQGIGSSYVKEINGIKKQYYSVQIGEKNYSLSEFQRLLWYYSNASMKLRDIIMLLETSYNIQISNDDICEQFFLMLRFALVFLRK